MTGQKVGRQSEKANTKKIGTEKLNKKLEWDALDDFEVTPMALLCEPGSGAIWGVRLRFTYVHDGSYQEFKLAFNRK